MENNIDPLSSHHYDSLLDNCQIRQLMNCQLVD